MEVSEAKLLKELERENTKLKKIRPDEMLKNRVLMTYAAEKTGSP